MGPAHPLHKDYSGPMRPGLPTSFNLTEIELLCFEANVALTHLEPGFRMPVWFKSRRTYWNEVLEPSPEVIALPRMNFDARLGIFSLKETPSV